MANFLIEMGGLVLCIPQGQHNKIEKILKDDKLIDRGYLFNNHEVNQVECPTCHNKITIMAYEGDSKNG